METPISSITNAEHKNNYSVLKARVAVILAKFGQVRPVTSGYRSMADHLRIYAEKGITDKNKIPLKSKHLFGQALDIADSDGKLKEFLKNNVSLLEENGLWCEDFSYTKTWVHFQIVAPASGKRFFIPK